MVSTQSVSRALSSHLETFHLGEILGYNVTVMDASGVVSYFTANTESVTISPLRCCSEYTFTVAGRTRAGVGMPSQVAQFTTESQFDSKY